MIHLSKLIQKTTTGLQQFCDICIKIQLTPHDVFEDLRSFKKEAFVGCPKRLSTSHNSHPDPDYYFEIYRLCLDQ